MHITDFVIYYWSILELLVSAYNTDSLIIDISYFSNAGFALFIFSSVIDLFLGLEMDGIVHGFLPNYLKYGESYLMSAWGAVVAYWDGTVFLTCYIIMAYLASNG